MDSVLSANDKQSMVSSFLEIAVGQTAETAFVVYHLVSWCLSTSLSLTLASVKCSRTAGQEIGDEVRAPLPVVRDTLYDDAMFYAYPHHEPSSLIAFRNFDEEMKRPGVWESEQGAASTADSSRDNLASLYRPPFHLMFNGSFEKAKDAASVQDKWLLVNLQSTKEFSSHMLNRDTWANEAVSQTISTNFIFWQVYDDTSEGKKVCTYYKLDSIPVVLVVDPITGQKMRSWCGMVQPESLLEELLQALAASMETIKDASGVSSSDTDVASTDKDEASATEKPAYPILPEEPKVDRSLLCRVGVRLPDGRRMQRNFLRTDPIQLLWSYCYSQLEGSEMKPFRLTHAIPGATKSLDYDSKLTFEDSGLANAMISVTWE
ncbi:Plant UBX domain-containing protein 7 [Citrus sinensis]|nr:Plant UBX domain-containing protein 7 [Citrus sinensis]